MRKVYTALAWIIAGGVVVQAAAIAFAFGGVLNRVSNGDVVDKALLESRTAGGVRAVIAAFRGRAARPSADTKAEPSEEATSDAVSA